MPSLPNTCVRCPSTVRSETKSAAATSRFVLPSATSAATRSSAGVSAPGVAARPLMRASSARARSAQSAAPIRSKVASASSSVARASRRRLMRRCAAPEREERTSPIEREVDLRVPSESLLVRSERTHRGPRTRGEQPAAASAVGERGDALEPRAFPSYQSRSCSASVSPVELDQRLDVVDDESDGPWLDDRLAAHEFERWIET